MHVSAYLAGGKQIALDKSKEGSPPDVRPIAVGGKHCVGLQGNVSAPS